MAIVESIREAIGRERQRKESSARSDQMALVCEGQVQEALENLIFFTPPDDFLSFVAALSQGIKSNFNTVDQRTQVSYLRFLADLTLGLRSILPRWSLQSADRWGDSALTDGRVKTAADGVQALVVELATQAPAATERLLAQRRSQTTARFKAEDATDPLGEAKALVGDSVGAYLVNASAALSKSNLRRIAEMRFAGHTGTELSNDYAAFLQHALYVGASFATTNPPLVDMAWQAEPERWNPVVDGIISENAQADPVTLSKLVTLEVVLANMRLLRPIFLLTTGQMGCVCLQVNPNMHGDATVMISDALFFYEQLRIKLGDGVPNVVFKLPGTRAGLTACRELTERGIGVTITVDFGMFQHIPFAEAIREGQAIFSCIVEMNGRLAYPVRDELLTKLDELAALGVDEAMTREAAAWAGVAVVKRLHRLLIERGYDLGQAKPLIASLRIYEGSEHEGLPSAFPDVTEVLGTSLISVFPNIRRAFDAVSEMALRPQQVNSIVPDKALDILTHSEIFKQAYYVANRDWVPEEDDRFQPMYELTLEDEDGTASWAPVHDTLTGFIDSYDKFVERILERT